MEVSDSKCSFMENRNSPQRILYCVNYRESEWLSKQNAPGLMDGKRQRESPPFQRHLSVCVHVCACVYVCVVDYMSRLQGLSVHISLNDKLQTVFTASRGEDELWGWVQTLFFQLIAISFSLELLSHAYTHTHTCRYAQPRCNPAVCDAKSPWQPYK